jgi:hypothetical protein
MNLSVSTTTVESYFQLLRNWDANSKKNLIIRLVDSLEPKSAADFSACFGAWQDDRDAEEIIREIYKARQNTPEIEEL